MTIALFSFFAAATIGFGLVVAFVRDVFRATFALFGTLGGVAALIALLGTTSVAALQILIYVGGVFVLFVFAILVTGKPSAHIFRSRKIMIGAGLFLALILGATIISAIPSTLPVLNPVSAASIGRSLVFENVLVFEAVSILLLAGLAGAVVVIRKEL